MEQKGAIDQPVSTGSSLPRWPELQLDRRCRRALDGQESRLCRSPPMSGESAWFAAGRHYPVARDDEGDGILSQSLSHGLCFAGLTQGPGDLAIRPRLSRRNLSSSLVYLPREVIRSRQVNNDVTKVLRFALEMLAQTLDDLGDRGRRCARSGRAGGPDHSRRRPLRGDFRQLKERHRGPHNGWAPIGWSTVGWSIVPPGDPAQAERRVEETVTGVAHDVVAARRHSRI
jgi:hypothetical protein